WCPRLIQTGETEERRRVSTALCSWSPWWTSCQSTRIRSSNDRFFRDGATPGNLASLSKLRCGLGATLRRRLFRRRFGEELKRFFLAHLLAGDRDGVLPSQATETDVFPGVLQRRDEPLHGEISERIRIDEVCDLRHRLLVRDELV